MANIVKNTTGTDLTLGPSWLGGAAPTSADVAVWVGGSLGGSLTLPASRSWQGINVSAAPTSAISVTGAGTLTVGVNGVVVDTTALNVTWATPVSLGANQSWTVGSGRQLTFSGVVSGTSRTLTLSGAGTTYLQGTNTYSGTTNISAGLVLAENSGFGTSAVSMTGGTVSSPDANPRSYTNALTLNGTVGLGFSASNGALTFSGTTTIAGTTALTAQGNNHSFTGTLAGTGAFSLAGGTIVLTGPSGSKSGGTTVAGGTVIVGYAVANVNQLGSDSITINSGNLYFAGTTSATVVNTITGSGGVLWTRNRNASGITFTNAGAYAGIVRIYAGTDDGATVTAQSMTFTAFPQSVTDFTYYNDNSVTVTQTIKYNGSSNVATNASVTSYTPVRALNSIWNHAPSTSSATMSVAGAIISNVAGAHSFEVKNDATGLLSFTGGGSQVGAGAMSLTKSGTGPVTLSGTFNYTGTVSVTAGTLNANSATALGAASSTAAISVTSGATLSLGAALNYSSPGRSTSISGTGSVASPPNGALIHNFAGTANIGSVSLMSDVYIRGTASGTSTLSSSISSSFASRLTAGAASGNTLVLTGGISTPGGLTIGNSSSDTGTVSLPTANTYSSSTRLAYGTLLLGHASALPSSSILVFQAGTLDASIPLTITNTIGDTYFINFGGSASVTLTSNIGGLLPDNLTVTTNGSVGVLTLSGVISRDNASYGFIKAGPNTLCLKGINTYTNVTSLQAGTLQLGHPQTVASSFRVDITQASAKLQTLSTSGQVGQNGKATIQELYNPYGGTIKIGG